MSAKGLAVWQPKARTFGDIKIPTEVTTDRTDTSRSERLRTFLDPLYGYSTLEKAKRGPRGPTAYNLFVKETLPLVVTTTGLKGKDAMIEVARRWKLHKGTSPMPLLLTEIC